MKLRIMGSCSAGTLPRSIFIPPICPIGPIRPIQGSALEEDEDEEKDEEYELLLWDGSPPGNTHLGFPLRFEGYLCVLIMKPIAGVDRVDQ